MMGRWVVSLNIPTLNTTPIIIYYSGANDAAFEICKIKNQST